MLLLVALWITACGGGTSSEATSRQPDGGGSTVTPATDAGTLMAGNPPPLDPSSCNAPATLACPPAQHVATATDLAAIANGLPWQPRGATAGAALRSSDDIVADADIQVNVTELTDEPSCEADAGASFCDPPLVLVTAYPNLSRVSGVQCKVEPRDRTSWGCPRGWLQIAKGATFRLRRELSLSVPEHVIVVVEPCADVCSKGGLLCPELHLCLSPAAWCLVCEGHSEDFCACRNEDCSMKPDGTSCPLKSLYYPQTGVCSPQGCVQAR